MDGDRPKQSTNYTKTHEATRTERHASLLIIFQEGLEANASIQSPDSHFSLRGELFWSRRPGACQSPSPSPPATQDSLKIFTEEVVLPVRVTDQRGRLDPTLHQDELLVLEDGVPQKVMSARQVPAQILLLISTAGDLNPAMKAHISQQVDCG